MRLEENVPYLPRDNILQWISAAYDLRSLRRMKLLTIAFTLTYLGQPERIRGQS
jgi:hypothetical protein